MTLRTSAVAACCSRLGQLAGEPSDIGLLASSGRATTAHRLRRNATLQLSRLAASRLNWFAACFGAPSHFLPLGSGRGIVGGQASTPDPMGPRVSSDKDCLDQGRQSLSLRLGAERGVLQEPRP